MNDVQEKETVRQRKRSPGYPMISLEEAIQKTKILWDKDKNNFIPKDAAFEHLGYKSEGGYGARVISALKQFGLIIDSEGAIKLTNEAVDLALHEAQDDIYIDTIKKLATKPNIYAKIYNEYNGNLPSDTTLKAKLIKDEGFNADKVRGFISDFRKTIKFACLEQADILTDKEDIPIKEGVMQNINTQPTRQTASIMPSSFITDANEREIANYPIGKGLKARILVSGSAFVTSDTVDKLISLLTLNKEDLSEVADFDLNKESETN